MHAAVALLIVLTVIIIASCLGLVTVLLFAIGIAVVGLSAMAAAPDDAEISGGFESEIDLIYGEIPDLFEEHAQYQLTQEIRNILLQAAGRDRKRRYEAGNILERWLLSMANDDSPGREWAAIYRTAGPETAYHQKMKSEVVEKGLATPTRAGEILKSILLKVSSRLDVPPPTDKSWTPTCTKKSVVFGKFSAPSTRRIERLVEIGGCYATCAVVMRYTSLNPGGQQWGLPQKLYDRLYSEFEVRNEGFASPLNSRLVGKPDIRFCSLFLDTDGPFGSLGSFFDVDMLAHHGNWSVNPPYIADIIERSGDRVLEAAARAKGNKKPFLAFFIMPAWMDMGVYTRLHSSPHKSAERFLARGTYKYETPDGTPIRATFNSIHFAFTDNGEDPGRKLHDVLGNM